MAIPSATFAFDLVATSQAADMLSALKELLEDESMCKVVHGFAFAAAALRQAHAITVDNVFDTQVSVEWGRMDGPEVPGGNEFRCSPPAAAPWHVHAICAFNVFDLQAHKGDGRWQAEWAGQISCFAFVCNRRLSTAWTIGWVMYGRGSRDLGRQECSEQKAPLTRHVAPSCLGPDELEQPLATLWLCRWRTSC
jgi:hypothetical protein